MARGRIAILDDLDDPAKRQDEIARSLGIDADISYGIYSAAASFLRETESDDLSVSYIFGGTINFKDVQVGGNYEVNPNLLDADVVKWYRLCGDSYVQRITRGASLYAALKFHFSDRLEKQQFESSFKVKGGLSVSAVLKEAQKVSQQSVQVSVFAVQVGGNVAELSSALSEVEVATCGMASIDHCLGYLQAIEHYASHSFPKQFVDGAGRPLTGAALDTVTATTHYESAPWHTLAIPHLPDLSDKPQATKLLQLYLKQFALKEKIGIILNLPVLARRGDEMAVIQREVLEADAVAVSQNGTIDKRPVLLRRYADGSVDVLSSRNTVGIDGKKVFDAAVKKFKDRWGDFWGAVD